MGDDPDMKDGYAVDIYPVRWKPYKPQARKQLKRSGRWQSMNGYGGWDNCDEPGTVYADAPNLDALDAELSRLRAQNEALVGALEACADLAWSVDTREVQFDETVVFGKGYDFEGLDLREEIFCEGGWFMVWPAWTKWYAYGGEDGTYWRYGFATKEGAKAAVVDHIAQIYPDHPAVLARAALSQAKEGKADE